MTVYVVTVDEYSSKRIVGVYGSLELAKAKHPSTHWHSFKDVHGLTEYLHNGTNWNSEIVIEGEIGSKHRCIYTFDVDI